MAIKLIRQANLESLYYLSGVSSEVDVTTARYMAVTVTLHYPLITLMLIRTMTWR